MLHRFSIPLCFCLFTLVCVTPALARQRCKTMSSCGGCCVVYDSGCCGCTSGCGSTLHIDGGCSIGCGDYWPGSCGSSSCSCGTGVIYGPVIEGTVIEGSSSILEGTFKPGEKSKEADKDPDDPFISSHGVRISASAIASASVTSPASAVQSVSLISTSGTNVEIAPRPQYPELAAMFYGEAYHEYWAGNYTRAHQLFSDGIAVADQDARLWYYQGLTEIALGREAAAIESLGNAVRVQSLHPEQNSKVSAALQRVQGSLRSKIEQARKSTALPAPKANSNSVPVSSVARNG